MRFIRFVGFVVGLLVLATAGASAVQAQTSQSFTLGPGGKAAITFTAFCLDFGVKFPDTIQAPNALAENKVRAALAYAQSKNLTTDEKQALEVQSAIWQLRGATGHPLGGTVAKDVVNAATTAPANPQGTSILDAVKAGQVTIIVNAWQPIGQKVPLGAASDYFYGQGTLTVENTSNQKLTLFMPVGAVFPPGTAGSQTMASFSTNVQITDPGKQAPQQLPATGAGDSSALLLLGVLGLLLFTGGIVQRHMQRS
jgi:LPXTG-motif cell wall-anchored protein